MLLLCSFFLHSFNVLWCFKICRLIKMDYYGCKVKLSTRKVISLCGVIQKRQLRYV